MQFWAFPPNPDFHYSGQLQVTSSLDQLDCTISTRVSIWRYQWLITKHLFTFLWQLHLPFYFNVVFIPYFPYIKYSVSFNSQTYSHTHFAVGLHYLDVNVGPRTAVTLKFTVSSAYRTTANQRPAIIKQPIRSQFYCQINQLFELPGKLFIR